jgi:flagellar protein FlaG
MSVASVGFAPAPVSPVNHPDIHKVAAAAVKQPEATPVNHQPEPKEKPHVNSTAADLERISHVFNKKLRFEIDHSSNEVIVKVIDKDTDKVIKELPPEELQRLHDNLKETIGILFDERV